MKIIVLGSPGVGKGTYTQELVKVLNLTHLSTGDIFREHIKNQTELGKQVESYLSEGKLVPDQLTIELVEERLSQPDCAEGFILDGFPRTISQAEALDKITTLDLAINFKANQEVIITRLSGRRICKSCKWIYHTRLLKSKIEGKCDHCGGDIIQRPDDTPQAIEKRLAAYEKEAAPLIEYYQNKGILREITINEEFGKYGNIIMERILKVINSVK